MTYLDYAAATPMNERVISAMEPYLSNSFYNPSAIYLKAREVGREIDVARHDISRMLGCQSSEVIFTAGATEADNQAIFGIMSRFPDKKIVFSGLEHSAIRQPAQHYKHSVVEILPSGLLDMTQLEQSIDDDTVLISVTWASNELGTIQPIHRITEIVAKVRADRRDRGSSLPLLVHSDASQAMAWCDTNINRSKVDMMTVNGGKIYGPKQTGLLYVRRGLELEPLIKGGGQESGLRSGTTNVAGVIGLAEAMRLVNAQRSEQAKRIVKLRDELEARLAKTISGLTINCQSTKRLANFSSLTFDKIDGERLVMELDELGVMCATGAACGAGSDQPNHALMAAGLNEEQINSTIRLSLGYPSLPEDVDRFIQAITKISERTYE